MYDTSFNTIIMDNSHDPKNDDGQASAVYFFYIYFKFMRKKTGKICCC